jgi:uncharacterized protein
MTRPVVPLSQFVLKVHSRCDLACDHCYVYEAADQGWRLQPRVMTDEVAAAVAGRIAEHAAAHRLDAVQVVLHGGEPLLAGAARLGAISSVLRSALAGVCDLDLRIHTNGVRLDERFCEVFAEHRVMVGISLDGDRVANDRHRRYADGRSSYDRVTSAVGLLRDRFAGLYAGLLCTIDVANDPAAVFDALVALAPPRVDFLLPHATWDAPPRRSAGAAAEYGDWLIAVYDRWRAAGRPVEVRTFASVISTSGGGQSLTEALGLGPSRLAVIETDGSYEQADSLKVAFAGATATGLHVLRDPVDSVLGHAGIAARQQGLEGLSRTCRQCPVVTSCGGGLYAHRFRSGTGFSNPSVYCADLLKLITHIRTTLKPATGNVPAPRSPGRHALSEGELRALAAGLGGASAIAELAEAQLSVSRALLGAVYRDGRRPGVRGGPAGSPADLGAAWAALTRIDQQNPAALRSVLRHPYLRIWAVRALEHLRRPPAGDPAAPDGGAAPQAGDAGLGHLGAIAAAATIRADLDARVALPVLGGAVHLPTLGRLVLMWDGPDGQPDGNGAAPTALIRIRGDNVTIVAGDQSWNLSRAALLARPGQPAPAHGGKGRWQPVRALTGPGVSVLLEDTDFYRDCHSWPAAPRLAGQDFRRWHEIFLGAWQEIRHNHPAYAPALAAGLRMIVPLAAVQASAEVSATSRHAFGSVGIALPDDPVALALLLIHEFQHVKLSAVLDLYDLFDSYDNRLFHAPWRDDPRPIEGLLQGSYAHLAVTGFWRARRNAGSAAETSTALARFSHWQRQTSGAIETLAASGSLTRMGRWFVGEMSRSIALLASEA